MSASPRIPRWRFLPSRLAEPGRQRSAVSPGGALLLATLAGLALPCCSAPTMEQTYETGETCTVTLALSEDFDLLEGELAEKEQAFSSLDVLVSAWGPQRVFPGGRLFLIGRHLGGEAGQHPVLFLRGSFIGSAGMVVDVDDRLEGEAVAGGERAEFPLDRERLAAWGLQGGQGSFYGEARLVVQVGEPPEPVELPRFALDFELVQQLRPRLLQVSLAAQAGEAVQVYPEDTLSLLAEDLLLHGEGTVELVVQGEALRGGSPKRSVTYALPVQAGKERSDGQVFFTASSGFGILPGSLNGEAWLRETTRDGTVWESPSIALRLLIQPPVVAGLEPPAASRGQWVEVVGRGFLPADDRGGTLLRLDGEFLPDDGSPPAPLQGWELFPDEHLDSGRLRIAFRTEVTSSGTERVLTGLAANPGRFRGTITPVISWDRSEVEGVPYEEGFVIAPTHQVIYIKYLPGFTVSLNRSWGLKNVERQVRQRVLEVCRRDYAGINISFTDERPRDFLEYTVIEVGGLDPNGRDLFGLDNTTGEGDESHKDVGNLRLQEIIGGKNAAAEEKGYLAYGGVFLESFRQFSTWLPRPISLASPSFDEVFSGIAPFLCGRAVEPDEYPDGPRAAEIERAIRVLGNLVGNTITHEVAHALGLSLPYGTPFEFHNLFDTPNAMMDAGQDRPFEERAELDGMGPEVFVPENLRYLQEILPLAR